METTAELKAAQADVTKAAFRLLNSVVQPAVKAGVANPLPIGGGLVVLETIGRVSGKPRPVPLMASRLCDRVVVTTVRSDSQWLKNIEADPAVTVWLNGKPRTAQAVVTRGALNRVTLTLDS